MIILIVIIFVVLTKGDSIPDPSYDHQNQTYVGSIKPKYLQNFDVDITPYFSPDHSVDVEVELIVGAYKKIDVMIPGFSSWVSCSYPHGPGDCIGCDPEFVRSNETFTIFQALLNAVHRGVHVRILTNNYSEPICPHQMDPLTFIQMAGAEVRYFATVTFLHDKYITRDEDCTAISSINYSYTSFMKNREAGIIFEDKTGKVTSYLGEVFEKDWALSVPKEKPNYTQKELEPCLNITQIPVVIPTRRYFNCDVSSPLRTVLARGANLKYFVSPDFAYDTIMDGLDEAKEELTVYIYQITSPNITAKLIELKNKGVALNILVSCAIYGEDDRILGFQQYKTLLTAGIKIRMAKKGCFSYSHQKYWIVDKKYVWLSSGNWSPPDLPAPPYTFPVYGQTGWRKVNRDMDVMVDAGDDLVGIFQTVYDLDYGQGFDYNGSEDFLTRLSCSGY